MRTRHAEQPPGDERCAAAAHRKIGRAVTWHTRRAVVWPVPVFRSSLQLNPDHGPPLRHLDALMPFREAAPERASLRLLECELQGEGEALLLDGPCAALGHHRAGGAGLAPCQPPRPSGCRPQYEGPGLGAPSTKKELLDINVLVH